MLLPTIKRIWRSRDTWFMFAFLGVCVYCVMLLRGLRESRPTEASSVLTVGQKLSNLSVTDSSGHAARVAWGADTRSSLVYIFREGCVWCSRNMANIRSLAAAAEPRYRIVGLALSDMQLRDYVTQNKLTLPVYEDAKNADGTPFEADGTPETLIVSPSGVIRQRWLGAYAGDTEKQIEQVFQIRLPGLSPEIAGDQYTIPAPTTKSPIHGAVRNTGSPEGLN